MNPKKLALGAAVALALGLLVWAAWPAPLQVEGVRITRGPFVRELVEDAQSHVRERFAVSAPVAGQLLRVPLKAGDTVAAGQTVAEILPAAPGLLDSRSQDEQRERVGAAQAAQARAQANQARARLALQQAQTDVQRSESLARQGFVSPTQQESTQLALQQRRQELTMADEELDSATHELRRLRIGLAPATGASKGSGSRAGAPWQVRSPIAGQVLRLLRDSEGPIAAGATIMDMGDPRQQEVVTELLTEDAANLPAQASASLSHWGGEGQLSARLLRIEPGAFTKVSALGVEEQRVRAVFEWLQPPPASLGDGFKMEIRIAVQQQADALQAPVSSVFPQGSGHAVFVLDQGRARLQAVEVLGRNGQQAWLRTPLAPGTWLVAYPPTTLRDGDRVRMQQP